MMYLVFFLLLGFISVNSQGVGYEKATDKLSEEDLKLSGSPNKLSKLFFITKQSGLWELNLSEKDDSGQYKRERKAINTEKALAMDYHYAKDLLFWTTYEGEIFSCPLGGGYMDISKVNTIYYNRFWFPVSIAVDYISDLLYVIDSRTNTLHVLDINGKSGANLLRSFDPVLANEYEPKYIEVDPVEGYIFLMDDVNNFDHIFRMKMDTTDVERLHPINFNLQRRMGAIALDRSRRKIVFGSFKDDAIESINYNSDNQLNTVMRIPGAKFYPFSLSVSENYIYGVNVTSFTLDPDLPKKTDVIFSEMFRCNYNGRDCKNPEKLSNDQWGPILQVKAASAESQRVRAGLEKICETRRPCQDICINLPKDNSKFTCRCKTGYRLKKDNSSCEQVNDFMLFENDNFVGALDPADEKPKLIYPTHEVFTPFKIKLRGVGGNQYGFDYNPVTKAVFYSGTQAIIKKDLKTGNSVQVVNFPDRDYGLLAVDWISDNIYFVMMEWDVKLKTLIYKIAVSSVTDDLKSWEFQTNHIPRTSIKTLTGPIGRVFSLAVHPRRGYVYYTSFQDPRYQLTRMWVDGSHSETFPKLGSVSYVTLDFEEDRFYYIDKYWCIHRANLDGSRVERVAQLPTENNAPLTFINGFAVHGDWVYVKDANEIRRHNKNGLTKDHWHNFDPYPFNYMMRSQLRIHSEKMSSDTNECSGTQYGKCTQLCFVLPDNKKSCDCIDGQKLNPDGMHCAASVY